VAPSCIYPTCARGRNEYAVQAFDRGELDELKVSLDSIARGTMEAGVVKNTARQIVADRILS